jgi:Uma2 family endonuclease
MEQLEPQQPPALPALVDGRSFSTLTEDDLPYDDGMPMESDRHVLQMILLMETLKRHWAGREDVAVHGNMFVYFSPEQVITHDFRGPDFFAAQGVRRREDRKSWLVWQEGKGPDVVIEIISRKTARVDKTLKKQIYQDVLQVPEYYWYDPFSYKLAGFILRGGKYEPIPLAAGGGFFCEQFNLALVKWEGEYGNNQSVWLRWALPDGTLLPTGEELAAQEQQRADEAWQRAEEEQQRAEEAQRRAEEEQRRAEEAQRREQELEALLARYRERFGDLPE